MDCNQQKNGRRVSFWAAHPQVSTLQDIIDKIQAAFRSYSITLPQQFVSSCSLDTNQENSPRQKSFKFLWKQVNQALSAIQKLLIKELTDSLVVILGQTFQANDSDDQGDFDTGIKILIVFYGLLKMSSVRKENSFKLLKWIDDIIVMSSFPICMELSNVVSSIKKKLIKLGFLIIEKHMKIEIGQKERDSGEQFFKILVSKLIKQKEKEVSQLEFQLCRVCESYQPLSSMAAHLKECERKHQIKYHQAKLQQKGNEFIGMMNKESQVSQRTKDLFGKIFQSFNGKNAIFKLKNNKEEIRDLILDYQMQNIKSFNSIIDLLKKYEQILKTDVGGETLSDHDSKTLIKSKRYVSIRGFLPSSSSLEPQSQRTVFLSHSQKTINSEKDSQGRIAGCRLADFQVIKKLGKGSYSQVYLVRKKNTRDLYAMKVIQFKEINEQRIQAFKKQQKIYKSINGNFNVKLYYSFREENLYFLILDFGYGGSFRTLLQNQVYLQQKAAKLYIANLILAVDAIHSMGIVHRDLKPDNIVIAEDGHLVLTDFNLSKLIKEPQNGKQNSFFGTPDYIAPQVLKGHKVTEVIDWFSVGVIAYEMIIGVTPFTDFSEQAVFQNILRGQIVWPQVGTGDDQISAQCKDFLQKMLRPDPKQRFGANGIDQIKSHSFFIGVNWDKIYQGQFMFVPQKNTNYEENIQLLEYIENKKQKVGLELISSDILIVRYDILKEATNMKVRSHRNSRFKIQKQLQFLKIQPVLESLRVKKQYSHNNLNYNLEGCKGQSCKEFLQEKLQTQKSM